MKVDSKNLKKFIIDAGLLSKQQIDKAAKKASKKKRKLEDILVEEKLISQENLAKLNAYVIGIPFVSLKKEVIAPI